ncbi:MAG: hypothetical protein ACYCOO_05100, partial [Chitinophagaceae bacterium]
MKNSYEVIKMRDYLFYLLCEWMEPAEVSWLILQKEILEKKFSLPQFNSVFISMIRHTGKKKVPVTSDQKKKLHDLRDQFTIEDWTLDRLGRVYWLLNLEADGEIDYVQSIDNLFTAADLN